MKLKNLLLAIAGGVAAISVFLPWYVASFFGMSASANGFGEGVTILGILALLVGLGAACWNVLIMLNIIKLKLTDKVMNIINSVIGGVMILLGIITIITVGAQTYGFAHAGFGVYLLIIAGVATIVMTWLKINKTIGNAPKDKQASK